jgi:hypothetical protein
MATAATIKKNIAKLEAALKSKATPKSLKSKLETQLVKSKAELSGLNKGTKPKTSSTKSTQSALKNLKELVNKNKKYKNYKGAGVDLERDADRPAKPIGRRTAKASGKTYYEYRANRIDVKQPPKRYPKLEKGGYMAKGGYVTDLDEVVASSDLKEELKSKMKEGDEIVAFGYTDYGGSFGDKVAIEYFKENHPKNIVFENSAYNGQNGIVFGEVAKDFLEQTEDYPLGYEDMESFYYEMQNAQEEKDIEYFLSDIKDKYTVKKDAIDWLLENKSGYYSIQPDGLDFSYSELENELEEEGLIKRKKMEKGGYMAKGGSLSSIKEEYDENEDNNAHSENVVLLAKHFGTKEDLVEAKRILALHEKEGHLTSENGKKRQELHLKLIEKARTAMDKEGIEFAKGGATKNMKTNRDLVIEEISSMTGLRKEGIEIFANDYELTDSDLSNIMQGIGRKMISKDDFSTAVIGNKNNSYAIEIVDFAKSGKGYKIEKGGYFAKGGLTEHGLKIGDTIISKGIYTITVSNKETGLATVDLNKGERKEMKAMGGEMHRTQE